MSSSKTARKKSSPAGGAGSPNSGGVQCICEETLELYVLGRLPGQQIGDPHDGELVSVEIHLLVCGTCQDRATELERETRELRAALAQLPEAAKPKTLTAGK
jgi:hypothetical protein